MSIPGKTLMVCDLISIREKTVQRFNLTSLVIKPSGKIVIADSRKVNQKSGIERPQKDKLALHFAQNCKMEGQLYMSRTITNRVRELRIARGWTQAFLANEVGVSRQSINSIERGRYVPSLLLALTFAKVFESSADQIFTLS